MDLILENYEVHFDTKITECVEEKLRKKTIPVLGRYCLDFLVNYFLIGALVIVYWRAVWMLCTIWSDEIFPVSISMEIFEIQKYFPNIKYFSINKYFGNIS